MMTRREMMKIGGLAVLSAGAGFTVLDPSPAPARERVGRPEGTPLGNMVAGGKPLDAADFAERIEKARRLLAPNKLDALFLEGGTNLRYFTGVSWWRSERTFGAVMAMPAPERGVRLEH